MLRAVWSALREGEASLRRRLAGIYVLLIAANLHYGMHTSLPLPP